MQSLVRSMPGLHKTLILANVRYTTGEEYEVDELAMATEHAPFRHKKTVVKVGEQRKKARTQEPASETKTEENTDSTRQVLSSNIQPAEVVDEEQHATNAP
jgi:hypothetical protein